MVYENQFSSIGMSLFKGRELSLFGSVRLLFIAAG